MTSSAVLSSSKQNRTIYLTSIHTFSLLLSPSCFLPPPSSLLLPLSVYSTNPNKKKKQRKQYTPRLTHPPSPHPNPLPPFSRPNMRITTQPLGKNETPPSADDEKPIGRNTQTSVPLPRCDGRCHIIYDVYLRRPVRFQEEEDGWKEARQGRKEGKGGMREEEKIKNHRSGTFSLRNPYHGEMDDAQIDRILIRSRKKEMKGWWKGGKK